MKAKKAAAAKNRETAPSPAKAAAPAWAWHPYAWVAAAIVLVFWAYGPALNGAFVFDDTVQAYGREAFSMDLSAWVNHVRPVLMFSYWANKQIAGAGATYPFHVVNLLIHLVSVGLMFLIVRRLLEWAGADASRRNLLAGFAAGVYLLHPAMTEAVAYIAGRSESFSTMWTLAAFTVFLYRPKPAVTWGTVFAVFLLFGIALATKEQTVTLPALLLLTDFWWNPGFSFKGIWANWKLYVPMACGAGLAVVAALNLIRNGSGAGFGIGITWYQYLFTEFRALLVYIGEFLWPVNLTGDWYFPFSKTIFEHGAIYGLAILAILLAASWYFRHRFRLAAYGFLVYLLMMLPTSSVIPIMDAVAERRLYYSVLGLLLIMVDLLSRVRMERKNLAILCAVVVLFCAVATRGRAAVWADDQSFWSDVVQKAPENARAHFHLGFVWQEQERWGDAIREYERVGAMAAPNADYRPDLLSDWGVVFLRQGRPEEALAKFQEAQKINNSAPVWTQIANAYSALHRWDEALAALATAQGIDAGFPYLYITRGKIHLLLGACAEAVQDFKTALGLTLAGDSAQQEARTLLPQASACAAGKH